MDLQRSQHTRVSVAFTHIRKAGARALVTGIAYPALDPPEKGAISAEDAALRIDTYKTWMRRETLRAFAHTFLKRGTGGVDAHHDHGTVGTIVESYLTPEGHPEFPPDVWVVTSEVYDSGILEQLDAGKIKGYSIEFVSEIVPQTLQVEGAGKVRTGEIVDPTPLFLSLVEKPAIRQPFTAVEFRAEPDAPDCGRVTRLVRVEEIPMPTDATTPVPPAAADPSGSPETPVTRAADSPVPPEPATPQSALVQAWREDFARFVTDLQARTSPVAERLPAAHRAALDQALQRTVAARRTASTRADMTMFEEVWNENHEVWAIQDAMSSAFYLLTGCYYECVYYGSGSLEARLADFLANVDAFRPVLVDLVGQAAALGTRAELDALTAKATAALGQRAGKALSKKNLETIKGCRDAAKTCLDGLQGMVDTYGGETETTDDDDAEDTGERSVRAAADPTPAVPVVPPAADPTPLPPEAAELGALRARVEALAAEMSATHARAVATDAEATRLRAELATATAAKEAAEARAQALEAAPLPSHAEPSEPQGRAPGDGTPQPRWSGFAPYFTPSTPPRDG